jgi:hypothetical protein
MIKLTMLPADDGDSLLLEYGDDTFTRRILIDAGRTATYSRIKPLLSTLGGFVDLLVVTHVDQDHILGVLAMLEDDDELPVKFGDVWFNGFNHLVDSGFEDFGPQDGEKFTSALVERGWEWNKAFAGRGVEVGRPLTWFDDGSSMTVLSPDRGQLEALIPDWVKECEKHGLIPGKDPVPEPEAAGFEVFGDLDIDALAATTFSADPSKTNRTSIGFLFEYDGKRLVFTGDADDRRLVSSLQDRATAEGGRLRIDALKVAHHGSQRNISTDLLGILDCPRYLISTSGARHHHPNDVAMARILKHGGSSKEICFNYRSRVQLWEDDLLRGEYGYTVRSPEGEDGFLTLEL